MDVVAWALASILRTTPEKRGSLKAWLAAQGDIIGQVLESKVEFIRIEAWKEMPRMPTRRRGPGSGVIGTKLYVVAGGTGITASSFNRVNEVFDATTNTWSRKADFARELIYPSSCVMYDLLFIISGQTDRYSVTFSMGVYDPATNTWDSRTRPAAGAGRQAGADVIDGVIYYVGGNDIVPLSVNSNIAYDFFTDTWTTKRSMMQARSSHVCIAIDEQLHVIGGHDNGSPIKYLNSQEAYNPATNSWSSKAAMPTARRGASFGLVGGRLHVMGGYNGSLLSINEIYDPVTNMWTIGRSMAIPRYESGFGIIDGLLYIAGGYDADNYLDYHDAYDATKFEELASSPCLDGWLYDNRKGDKMLNSLDVLREARELGADVTLAQVEAALAQYDYLALRQAERANYRVELYDKTSPINGVPAEKILRDAPPAGEVYLIYINDRLTYLQTHDPEEMGFRPMSPERAYEAAEQVISEHIEQVIDARVRQEVLRQLLLQQT